MIPRALTAAFLSLALGCSTQPIPVGGAPPDLAKPLFPPLVHRSTAPTCPPDRAPANCSNPTSPMSSCAKDLDCTAGMNPRCLTGRSNCYCSYDACATDADCPTGQLCDCRAAGTNAPNRCLASNCRTDSDCGANGYCSPSFDITCGAFSGVAGWFCHTAEDSCTNDSDCANVDGGTFGKPYCAHQPQLGHWVCSTSQCAG